MIAGLALAVVLAAAPNDMLRLPGGHIQVHAAHLELTQKRVLVASGGVDLTAPGIRIHAETVSYDTATRVIDVSGGMRMTLDTDEEHAELTASSATIDAGTHAGVLRDATLQGAGITLKGKRIVRTASGRYRLDAASFTPCQCADGRPSWEITASRITARPEGLGILQGGVLRAKGIPIFFLPIGFAPVSAERASGFLSPQFAQTGNDGTIVSLPFYLAPSKRWDMILDPGYDQERGVFVGGTLRLANSAGQGELAGVYHHDRRVQRDAATFPGRPDLYSPDRWYTDDRLTEQISSTVTGKARVELAGDDRYGFDFGSSLNERSRPDYETDVFLQRAGDVVAAVVSSTYYQDLRVIGSAGPYNSAQTVSRIGGVDLSAASIPLLGGRAASLEAGVDGRYDFFDNLGSPQAGFHRGGQLEAVPRRQVQHARLQPVIAAPLSFFDDAVRVRAFAGGLGDVSSDPLGTDSRARVAPQVGGDARMEVWKTFGTVTKLQHRVGPFARWTYTPEIYGDDTLTSFEAPNEVPHAGNVVEVGLTNRLLYRGAGAAVKGLPVRELLDLSLYERYEPLGPRKGESVGNMDVRTGPLRMDLDAVLDNEVGRIRTAGGRAATRGDAPEGLSVEYAYAPERSSHQGTAGAWLKLAEIFTGEKFPASLFKTLTLESGVRYDLINHNFPSVSGGVSYESPCGCWGFHAGAAKDADRPNLTLKFSIDLHPPSALTRYTTAPGGR